MSPEFVHLHTHSDYSLLDGASPVPAMVRKVAALGMKAVALTDHGNLFGAIEFYQHCTDARIKPILGIEAYVAPGSRHDRTSERGDAKSGRETNHHLTLLARNEAGYRNLVALSSLAYREGFYYKPRMDKELLAKYSDGLTALSGCPSSEFGQACRAGQIDRALAVADQYCQIFGRDHFFLEIQEHGWDEERKIAQASLEISRRTGLPIVATNDSHYLERDDHHAHDALLAIHTGTKIADTERMRFPSPEFYIKSPQQMAEAFPDLPEALSNTLLVAEQCDLKLKFGEIYLPPFPLPKGFKGAIDYLRVLCDQGARSRYPAVTDAIQERLAYELSVIEQMGFASYFLIVWDIRRHARESGIRVGPGRGSAAGSLVSYVLGITNLDPLRYDLIFERFLNPGRREMPDIDVDFSNEDRPKVIEYLHERYGKENVAQIITFGKMKARAVVRDVGRVMGWEYSRCDQLAKKIPHVLDITLEQAREMEPELAKLVKEDPETANLWEISRRLEGLCRHASKHASGVLISDRPLIERLPIYVSGEDETTQYEMNAVAKLGLLKIDILGLETLTVLDRAVKLIEQTTGKRIDLERLPLDDRKTFDMLGRGEVAGVFQLETSRGMRELVMKMKPDCIEDLIATIALFRPGPLQSGMVDDYIDCKHGKKKPVYLHPELEPVLRETHGVMLYQEQVMRIANRLAGFPMSDADALRKAMGKKKAELLAKYHDPFVKGAVERGIDSATAGKIFELMAHFAGYGFNKSHSAAYGMISYQTAHLKALHPAEFMAAALSCNAGDDDKIAGYLEECRTLGIAVLPPDVNESDFDFRVIGGRIRFGLSCIKGAGERAISAIVQGRSTRPYTTFTDFCERADLHGVDRKTIENLIKAGAFDSTGAKRAGLLESMESTLRTATMRQQERSLGQLTFFDGLSGNGGTDVPVDAPEWPQETLLGYEKEALGFYVTGNPIAKYGDLLKIYSTTTVRHLPEMQDGAEVRVGGILSNMRAMVTKNGPNKGNRFVTFRVTDLSGSIEAVAFSREFDKYREQLANDNIVFLRGRVGFRNDVASLRVQEVIPASEVRATLTGSIRIQLPQTANEVVLKHLSEVLGTHRGSIPVFLESPSAEGRRIHVRLPTELSVSASDRLLADIEEVTGAGSARFSAKGLPESRPDYAGRPRNGA